MSECVYMHACVRACVRACIRACVCVYISIVILVYNTNFVFLNSAHFVDISCPYVSNILGISLTLVYT